MSNILVINSGSASIKFKVFDQEEKCLKEGILEISQADQYEKAIKNILRQTGNLSDLAVVGHRIVHGGDKFFDPVLVNEKIAAELEQFNDLAPLHNPFNLAALTAAANFLPEVPQVAVFDTGFYRELPEVARFYGLPAQWAERYKIRRYGFHGISHEYASQEGAKQLGLDLKKANLITCHLGGGWSVTAVKKGRPIDTSMGFTPMEGLMMMTRPGDIDPGVIFYLEKQTGFENEGESSSLVNDKLKHFLNHESGIKGVSNIADYKELLRAVSLGNPKAKLAFDMAVYRLVKYIGSYYTVLGGQLDGIIFTGRVGAGLPDTRNAVMRQLKFMDCPGLAILPNEELMIARKIRELINKR